MVSVDPSAIRFFKTPNNSNWYDVNDYKQYIETKAKAEQSPEKEAKKAAKTSDQAGPTAAESALVAELIGEDAPPPAQEEEKETPQPPKWELTPFYLPHFASPWLFIPAYIEINFATCSAIYVRHPTARPGYSEIPTPYDADGEVVRFAWEWYVERRPRVRTQARLARMPEDRALSQMESVDEGRKKLRRDILLKSTRL